MTTITMQRPPAYARFLAGLLSLLLGLGPIATPAFADLTPLADQPLGAQVSAKPNVVLTIDDSTSMLYDFLPDITVGTNCRDGTGARKAACGWVGAPYDLGTGGSYLSVEYIYEQYGFPYPAYTSAFPASGPGAGCSITGSPPTCSPGISPGPLPGIATYPTTSGSPQAGQPYGYWLLWPAPAHNSAMNALYYNPMLTYAPADASDGTPYPSMNSANTTGWTRVPANPFLHLDNPWGYPADTLAPLVDLTATVTVGQWCNSDWTQGNDDSGNPFAANQSYCRSNGNISASDTDSTPANNGDYSYPWAPANITPNDVTSKVDTSTINYTSIPAVNATVKPAWATAQNGQFFFENDNVLWCDISSPDWPVTSTNPVSQYCDMGLNPINQTCNGYAASGTCSASSTGNCSGAVTGTCNTGNGVCANYVAGACNTANGVCNGTNGACNTGNGNCNAVTGVCNTANGVCNGVNGACNTGNGNCSSYVAGACGTGQVGVCAAPTSCNATHEACVGGTVASCNGITSQTCVGTNKTCDAQTQSCNGYQGPQTCTNVVSIPPDPSTCTQAWVPTGCNLNPDPEAQCTYTTTCPPPTQVGTCSIKGNTCSPTTAATDCPTLYGKCSLQTSKQCSSAADCTGLKYCNGTSTTCNSSADCPVNSGKCSLTNATCSVNTDCPNAGTCNYQNTSGVTNGTCGSTSDCKPYPNHCATTTATACTTVQANSASCPIVAGSGTCNNGGSCTTVADCVSKCTNSAKAGVTCTSNTQCNVTGTCTAGLPSTTACLAPADCNKAGACTTGTNTGASCTANGTNSACGPIDKCSAGLPSTTTCTTAAQCNTTGTCTSGTNTGSACSGSGANATCGVINKCTAGNVGANCTSNSACNANGTCTTGTNTGTVCTTAGANSTCGPIDKCSAGLPNTTTCTTAAQCNTTGTCTTGTNTGAACSGNGTNATCGAINKCSAGLPSTTSCTTASQCNKSGSCTSGANTGQPCSANGTNASCGVVNKCTAGKVGSACTTSASCNVTGTCTTGNVGALCTTNGSTTQCGLSTGVCSNNAGISCTNNTPCAGSTGYCSTDTATTCTANSGCAPYGHCSVQTGNRCRVATQGADCPTQPGTLNPVSARCDTTGVSGNVAITLLADANGSGKACRRNNHTYSDVSASRFNYPSGKFTTPITGEINAGQGCHATNRYANVPRHYWKTSLEWCDNQIGTAADKWNGYGDSTVGTCQAFQDSSHVYPRFYQFGLQTDAVSNYTTAAFQREDLISSNTFTHTSTDTSGQTTTITRTYAQEMENYANWFAYYHDRIQAVKTATSLAFLGTNTDGTYNLDETKFRVGLHTLSNNPSTSFVDVQNFSLTQKAKWATQLFGIDIKLYQETPSLNAMARIGDYFQNGSSSSLTGASDPIILSCQKNFHMLFTDGITNQTTPTPPLPGNVDNLVPALDETVTGLTPGQPWPAPFREDASAPTSNSLSDYATYYWATDLRTTGPLATNNVATTKGDPATWQHINFAALSLGTQGKLTGNQAQVQTQLTAGTIQWPTPYPSVNKPDASGVDDLWHAAVNGRGRFVNAKSVAELQVGMGAILADAAQAQGTRNGAAFTNNNLSTTADNFIYRSTFQPSWGGTLDKIKLDPVTAAEVTPSVWQAQVQLAAQLTSTPTIPNPWRDNRKVVTLTTTGSPVPFLWDNISASQQDSLAPGNPDRGQRVLAWLRGDQSNEGSTLGDFRARDYSVAGALGDIVDSSAQYVGAPNFPFQELNDPGYSTFVSTWASRPGRVYVGANDGMLHAFDDLTGNETFGYVPRALFRAPSDAGLGSLTYQFAGLPSFIHHYFVDGTPKLTDVAFGVPSAKNWHSILVGGLGKGGTSYYALDVTNPGGITSESTAASNILWEFTDPDMGYTYGPPLVTKTRAFGGQWVVILPSGYNNASGVGKLWFLDPQTGSVLKTMSTNSGTATDPAGLAQIAGYTQNFQNYLTDQIYAGDLHGNVWRFDILDPNPDNWVVSKFAKLTDPSGVAQPVTTPPQIEIDIENATDRWVFVGTGKLLDDSDLSNTQIQTMYAFRDGTTKLPSAIVSGAPIQRSDLSAIAATSIGGLASAPAKGWLQDLTDVSGQRIVTPVQAALSVVVFAATSPNTDPCLIGQPAEIFARGYGIGDSKLTDPNTGVDVASINSSSGAVGISIITTGNDGSGQNPDGSLYVPTIKGVITVGNGKETITVNIKSPSFLYASRMSWRTLNE